MCGLAGFFNRNVTGTESGLRDELSRMSLPLRPRGPDSEGTWLDLECGIGMAHRRLAIQDLSAQGHQPMLSADGRYVIAFNGEIYNFMGLKKELEKRGEVFRGHSDTEVMLASFTTWGIFGSIRRFNGMFAFAVWDRERQRLYLARDRIGEKPLYYGWQGNSFLFGSELKALRQHHEWRNDISRDVLTLFLRHNYIPGPYSIFNDIFKLEPGALLELDGKSGRTTTSTYWSFRDVYEHGIADPLRGTPEDIADGLETRLRASISRQMIADVPVGVFLSGGIDSTTITALMQSIGTSPVKTFTIGFSEGEYNEANHARAISEYLQTEHTELYVTPKEAMDVVPMLPEIYDEPFADSSQIPTFLLSRLAREKVTVALSGDAGDELFCGYQRYFQMQRHLDSLGRYPRHLIQACAHLIKHTPVRMLDHTIGPLIQAFSQREHRLAGERLHTKAEFWLQPNLKTAYLHKISYWRGNDIVLNATEPRYILNNSSMAEENGSILKRLQCLDTLSYLPDDILVKVDRASMANSLETRIPLLDQEIIEYAARIPDAVNCLNQNGKWPLRKILSAHVPESLTERPKQGFAVPICNWLRGPLYEWASDLLNSEGLETEGLFDVKAVQKQWQDHASGFADNSFKLWGLLMFESWYRSGRQR